MAMRIVTVSREFGSGGREVGKRLADKLGFAYYDREILTAIAEATSLDESFIEYTLENSYQRAFNFTFSHTLSMAPVIDNNYTPTLLAQQHKIIRSLSEKGNCVIVGRSADEILSDLKPFKLFVYADTESKLNRCKDRMSDGEKNLTDKELVKKMKQIDRSRAFNHDMISSRKWGAKESYDLCVNTSNITIKEMIPSLAEYINNWFTDN